MLYVFAVFFGLAFGGTISVFALMAPVLFGLKYLGTIIAATFLLATIGGATGPPLAGFIFDTTGNYNLAFLICVMLGVLNITLSFILLRSKSYKDVDPIKLTDMLWGLYIGIAQLEESKLRSTNRNHLKSTLEFAFSLVSNSFK